MRVKLFAVVLLPFFDRTASMLAEALALLETQFQSKKITDAELEASTEVFVDLYCLGQLITNCGNGNESAWYKVDKTEPLPCMIQTKPNKESKKSIDLAHIDNE